MRPLKIVYEDLSRLHAPISHALEEVFRKSLEKGNFILGEDVEAFEEKLAYSTHRKFAIGVSSGTAALTLLLKAMQAFNNRKQVILPAMVCMPVVAAVLEADCEPIFVDVLPGRYTIDHEAVNAIMSDQVLAVIAVHLYGHVCDLDALQEVCKKHSAYLIEDCAQAQGAFWRGLPVGSFGDAAAFSFYPTKHLGALGDAGAVVLNEEKWAEHIRKAREYGSLTRGPYTFLTGNYRMDALQAALLLAKWPFMDQWIEKRNEHAYLYKKLLKNTSLELPANKDGAVDASHIFPVLSEKRGFIMETLKIYTIETTSHYPYVSALQPVFLGKYKASEFPVAYRVANEQLSLPCSPIHDESDIKYVSKVLKLLNG